MAKIHISCPLSVSEEDLDKVSCMMNGYYHMWTRWERCDPKVYKESWIQDADAVLFILPSFKWFSLLRELPTGVAEELRLAVSLKKKLFIAYKLASTKELRIYKAQFLNGEISGIADTCHVIKTFEKSSEFINKVYPTCSTSKIELIQDILDSSGSLCKVGDVIRTTDIRLLLMKR